MAQVLLFLNLQNESSPNFSNFRPTRNSAPNFPRIFGGVFVLRFVGNGGQKKFTKNPRHFSMQNSQANSKQNSTKVFCRAGKVKFSGCHLKQNCYRPVLLNYMHSEIILELFRVLIGLSKSYALILFWNQYPDVIAHLGASSGAPQITLTL